MSQVVSVDLGGGNARSLDFARDDRGCARDDRGGARDDTWWWVLRLVVLEEFVDYLFYVAVLAVYGVV